MHARLECGFSSLMRSCRGRGRARDEWHQMAFNVKSNRYNQNFFTPLSCSLLKTFIRPGLQGDITVRWDGGMNWSASSVDRDFLMYSVTSASPTCRNRPSS